MSNFMLNGINGNVKGGMLDSKMLFNNEGQWQKLELASSSDLKGDAFGKIDNQGQLHVTGYVKGYWRNNSNDLDVFNLPDSFPKKFEEGSSDITDLPNPLPIWWDSVNDNTGDSYDYLDVKDCQAVNGVVQLMHSYGTTRINSFLAVFPDIVMKPAS